MAISRLIDEKMWEKNCGSLAKGLPLCNRRAWAVIHCEPFFMLDPNNFNYRKS